jgi:type IV secretion system protein TrbJ
MSNINMQSRLVLAACLFWLAQPAKAFFGSGVVYDPTHTAHTIAEGVKRGQEAATALQNQVNQLNLMVRNITSLGDPILKPIGDAARSVYQGYWQVQGAMYSVQNMGSMFNQNFPNYQSYLYTMGQGRSMSETMPTVFKKWSDSSYENTRNAMKSAGMHVDNLKTEEELLQNLIRQADSADGQSAKTQALAQIAGYQSRQFQDLGRLVAEQMIMQANFMAQENERRTADNAFVQNFKSAKPTNSPAKGR